MIAGVGVDLLEVERLRAALERTPSIRDRLFTAAEQAVCGDRVDRLAARFAAKEAVAKALGTGIRGFAFLDVEVVTDELGAPSVRLHGAAVEVAAARGVDRWHLSLSTADTHVVAYAIAESLIPQVPHSPRSGPASSTGDELRDPQGGGDVS